MLLKSHITKIQIHSEEWHKARLGKFTASEIHLLMGEKQWTEGALSYIFRKVGEELSGLPCRDDIDTNATKHGNAYEPEALKLFQELHKPPFLVTQTLIYKPESRFSCTPDALIVKNETSEGYSVESVEVKCPYSYDAYIKLFLCNEPKDILATEKKYFWQVLDQMQQCDCINGNLVIYQPHFKAGKIKVIPFRKIQLIPFFETLKQRKEQAELKFIEIRDKLINS